jgi:hypothetical protein
VTVTPSAPAYRPGEVIEATVVNGRGDTIYTADGRTDCSIVMLERWDGQRFVPIPACLAGRMDRLVAIGPGLGRTVRIDPGSGHFGGTRLGAGTYRMALDYGLDPGRDAARPFVVHSPTLEIRG